MLQWAPLQLVGQLLYNGMMVLINNLSVILCVGVAAVHTRTEKQDAALLALMAYLVFLAANHTALEALGLLAQPNGMTGLAARQTTILGIRCCGHRRGKRHRAGLCGGVALQPHL